MAKTYTVCLHQGQRAWLRRLVSTGRGPAREQAHARVLLKADEGPSDEKVVLVMDQLNTHSPASLYDAFAPEEAKRLAGRLEIHHTPKHGSWPNVAEVEVRWASGCPVACPTPPSWQDTWRRASGTGTEQPGAATGSSPPRTHASN
jgi:hypothetical protein